VQKTYKVTAQYTEMKKNKALFSYVLFGVIHIEPKTHVTCHVFQEFFFSY